MRLSISIRGSVRPSVRPSVRNAVFYLRVCPSFRRSVRQSVTLFLIARKCVFLIIETARDFVWRREVIGSDEGAGKGVTREGVIRKEVKNTRICASEKRHNTVGQTNGRTERRSNTDRQTLLKSCLDATKFAKKGWKPLELSLVDVMIRMFIFLNYFSMHKRFHTHPISLIFSKHDKSMTLHSIPFHECL